MSTSKWKRLWGQASIITLYESSLNSMLIKLKYTVRDLLFIVSAQHIYPSNNQICRRKTFHPTIIPYNVNGTKWCTTKQQNNLVNARSSILVASFIKVNKVNKHLHPVSVTGCIFPLNVLLLFQFWHPLSFTPLVSFLSWHWLNSRTTWAVSFGGSDAALTNDNCCLVLGFKFVVLASAERGYILSPYCMPACNSWIMSH